MLWKGAREYGRDDVRRFYVNMQLQTIAGIRSRPRARLDRVPMSEVKRVSGWKRFLEQLELPCFIDQRFHDLGIVGAEVECVHTVCACRSANPRASSGVDTLIPDIYRSPLNPRPSPLTLDHRPSTLAFTTP